MVQILNSLLYLSKVKNNRSPNSTVTVEEAIIDLYSTLPLFPCTSSTYVPRPGALNKLAISLKSIISPIVFP